MPRRIHWALLLLLVLGFTTPGAVHAARVVAAPPVSVGVASSVGPDRPEFSPPVVRQGVEIEEGRSEKAGAASRRSFVGAVAANGPVATPSSPTSCHEHRGLTRSSSPATVARRAPPTGSV